MTNWHCTGPMNIGVSVVGNSTSDLADRLHGRRSDRRFSEPDTRRIGPDGLQQHERFLDADLRDLLDAGRRDQV